MSREYLRELLCPVCLKTNKFLAFELNGELILVCVNCRYMKRTGIKALRKEHI